MLLDFHQWVRTSKNHSDVGIAMINHPFLMVSIPPIYGGDWGMVKKLLYYTNIILLVTEHFEESEFTPVLAGYIHPASSRSGYCPKVIPNMDQHFEIAYGAVLRSQILFQMYFK